MLSRLLAFPFSSLFVTMSSLPAICELIYGICPGGIYTVLFLTVSSNVLVITMLLLCYCVYVRVVCMCVVCVYVCLCMCGVCLQCERGMCVYVYMCMCGVCLCLHMCGCICMHMPVGVNRLLWLLSTPHIAMV